MSEEVAKTILEQIKATDRWALARWGVLPKKLFVVSDPAEHLGGLSMGTKQNLRIEVTLNSSDTYRVLLFGMCERTHEPVLMAALDDVYCDDLVQWIDSIVDEALRKLRR